MNALKDSLVELIRRTSAEIPDDVNRALVTALENEKKGTIAASALKIIEQNIELAKRKSQPICQDTGSVIFYVDCPVGFDQIACEEAAREAVKVGAEALVVSNHGGRQLDGAPSSIEVLPDIVHTVGSHIEVLFDGGVRSGQDVMRALALGARACMIGRACPRMAASAPPPRRSAAGAGAKDRNKKDRRLLTA